MSRDHYNDLSSEFIRQWQFSEEYHPTFVSLLTESLDLEDGQRFLDLGCGVGHYTQAIVEASGKNVNTIGVDYSEAMIDFFNGLGPSYEGRVLDLQSFVKEPNESFDRILLKEVIHHVDDLYTFFSDLAQLITKDGKALIVTRPKTTKIPLFKKARDSFSEGQPSVDKIQESIEKAGLKVEPRIQSISISISTQRYLEMIDARYMSILRPFTDQEIESGKAEIIRDSGGTENLDFSDDLLFLSISHHA